MAWYSVGFNNILSEDRPGSRSRLRTTLGIPLANADSNAWEGQHNENNHTHKHLPLSLGDKRVTRIVIARVSRYRRLLPVWRALDELLPAAEDRQAFGRWILHEKVHSALSLPRLRRDCRAMSAVPPSLRGR